jgi:hypothetical protein
MLDNVSLPLVRCGYRELVRTPFIDTFVHVLTANTVRRGLSNLAQYFPHEALCGGVRSGWGEGGSLLVELEALVSATTLIFIPWGPKFRNEENHVVYQRFRDTVSLVRSLIGVVQCDRADGGVPCNNGSRVSYSILFKSVTLLAIQPGGSKRH